MKRQRLGNSLPSRKSIFNPEHFHCGLDAHPQAPTAAQWSTWLVLPAQSFLQVPTTLTQTPSQPQAPAHSPMSTVATLFQSKTKEESQNHVELNNL